MKHTDYDASVLSRWRRNAEREWYLNDDDYYRSQILDAEFDLETGSTSSPRVEGK